MTQDPTGQDLTGTTASASGSRGQVLGGKYELGERIGGGGMADVFRGATIGAQGFAREVAIKRVKRSISSDRGFATLFVEEAKLAAMLAHPNIVQTFDFDRDLDGRCYLVMEMIHGVDLRELCQSGPLPVPATLHIASEALRALDYAHEMVSAGGNAITVVHRDISPHNLMVSWSGSVKLVDFGIAKAVHNSRISKSDTFRGKVAYMSPEQVHGLAVDGRSDLFALGVVLHEMLTGTRLFRAESEAATLSLLLTSPIAPPSYSTPTVPAALDQVILKMLRRERHERYARAADVLADLQEIQLATHGHSELEAVLRDRFPERVPERVHRISQKRPDAPQKAPTEPLMPVMAAPTLREFAAIDMQAPAPSAKPKRTITAEVIADEIFSQSASTLNENRQVPPPPVSSVSSRREPLLARTGAKLLVGCALAVIVGVGAAMMASRRSSDRDDGQSNNAASPHGNAEESNDAASPHGNENALAPSAAPSLPTSIDDRIDASLAAPSNPKENSQQDTQQERSAKAAITFRVRPWATVEVDGRQYGQTPLTIPLSVGKHKVVLENQGISQRDSFRLRVRGGKDREITRDWTSLSPSSTTQHR